MSKRLKICVVTGSRAEYGLLYPLLKKIKEDKGLQLQLLVTGMHLSPAFGLTYKQIEADGFVIDEKVDMLVAGDTETSIIKSTGLGMIGFADANTRIQPDWLVVLGDRFETFAAASAAHLARIPVAHLHGGELTEGATDDAMRHAITKMSYLHFTSAAGYKKRVEQLGEDPKRVFNVGAIGIDNIRELPLLGRKELLHSLGVISDAPLASVSFHPVTLETHGAEQEVKQMLDALKKQKGLTYIFTKPNADAGNAVISNMIDAFVAQHPERAFAFTSLGQLRYLSLLRHAAVAIGNSSSGIIEAPYLGCPVVNIGNRQTGRIKPSLVIDTEGKSAAIHTAIEKALQPAFRKQPADKLYGNGGTASKIITILKKTGTPRALSKRFHDLNF